MSTFAALTHSVPADQGFALIPNRKLYAIYSRMVASRLLGTELARRAKKAGTEAAASVGLEAALVAATIDLEQDDTLVPGEQAPALVPCFLKGLSTPSLAAVLKGKKPRQDWASLGIVPPAQPLAAQLLAALTAAQAHKKAKNKKLVVAFTGDSGVNNKLLTDAMKLAHSKKLPVLFVCHTGADGKEMFATARRIGMPGVVVDEQDAVAVYRVVTESAAHARRGNGPTLIECRPWPLVDEVADPLTTIEAALKRRGFFTVKLKAATLAAAKKLLEGI
ncbi:thiamine pyrophosphate-dependent enzyme [Telmatobacter bradus]|uniref:thiamine pyrophosphate-dependent enzyme n=1 Tax=Telmatobacter bradus TaxID=474953 RepID=UPI003B434E47